MARSQGLGREQEVVAWRHHNRVLHREMAVMELIGLVLSIGILGLTGWWVYECGRRDGRREATAILTSSRSPLSPEEAVRLHGDGSLTD